MPRPKPAISNSQFTLRLNDELRYRLELYSYVRQLSMGNVIELALAEYLKRHKLDDNEVQLIRNIIHKQMMNDTGRKIAYESKEVTDKLNEFFTIPKIEKPAKIKVTIGK